MNRMMDGPPCWYMVDEIRSEPFRLSIGTSRHRRYEDASLSKE